MLRRTSAVADAPNPWGWPETAAIVGYLLLVGTGLRWHEPWADEAQAWLLARDMGWFAMAAHGLRYEGSPALWHSLLWLLARLHAGFAVARWVGGAFAACGMAVLLSYAPFPRVVRLLLPFTFFLAYQQAVIARSYVLVAALLFGACALLRRTRPAVLAGSLLLALLANVSLHGFVLSVGMAAAAWVVWRRQAVPARKLLLGGGVLLLAWAAAVATTFPPPDLDFPAGRNLSRSWLKMAGRPVEPDAAQAVLPGELAPFVPPPVHRKPGDGTRRRVLRLLALMTFPLSTVRLLGLLACTALAATALHRSSRSGGFGAAALLPYGLMLLVFQAMYLAPRHAGTMLLAFLASTWLAWPRGNLRESGWGARSLTAVLLAVCAEQISWTARAVWLDVHQPYAGNPQTAALLRSRGAGQAQGPSAAGFYYHSVGTLPYFDRNIYENQPEHSYWLWSTRNRIDARAPFALASRPDLVVVSGWSWGDNADVMVDWAKQEEEGLGAPLADSYGIRPFFLAHGYRETHRFCGRTWMRMGYAEQLCDVVLEPGSAGVALRSGEER